MENLELPISDSLTLKALDLEDLHIVLSAVEANRNYSDQGLFDIKIDERKIQIRAFLENHLSSSSDGEIVRMGIWLKDKFIGAVSLVNLDKKHKKASLTYWFIDEHYQNEYLLKSCEALIEHGFNRLYLIRIELLCFEYNLLNCAEAEKLTFIKEGIFRSYIKIENEYFDVAVYSKTSEDFNQSSPNPLALVSRKKGKGFPFD